MPGSKTKTVVLISLLLLLVVMYAGSGIFSLQSGQRALILRFGQVVKEVSDSGIHYRLPAPIERTIKIHIGRVQTVFIQERKNDNFERFTGDENLIIIHALISYDIKNLTQFAFQATDVKPILQSAGQMCLSRELAKMTVDDAMTTGKSVLRLVIKEQMQQLLDEMKLGIRLISVELTDISPPEKVSTTFRNVSDAWVKKQEIVKDAEGYTNAIIPKSRGKASALILEAEAYSKEVVSAAKGKVDAFDRLLIEYDRNPQVITDQKRLETMQVIFNKCKVSIDANPKESMYYISR